MNNDPFFINHFFFLVFVYSHILRCYWLIMGLEPYELPKKHLLYEKISTDLVIVQMSIYYVRAGLHSCNEFSF